MPKAGKLGPLKRKAKAEGWSGWIRNAHDERALLAGCTFEKWSAEKVRKFFLLLRHSKGRWAGQSFELMRDQWEDIIAPIFGWLRADGTRRVRKAYIEVAKKNYKSTLGSGIGLYGLVGDSEAGAEVYSAATKQDQASIVHAEAIKMVRVSPLLMKRLRINESTKTITYPDTQSKYAALSADSAGSEGLNIHFLIADELHAWSDRGFLDSLRYGFAARSQPLWFIITTAGVFDVTSIGWQEHEYAQRWLDDKVEDQEYHAYIRAAGEKDDILDPETHKKANPGYGITIDPAEIAKSAKDATERPSELFAFLRYRLNIWTQAFSAWLPPEKWAACSGAVDEDELAGRVCYGGLDLASKTDITSWVLCFPPVDDGELWRFLIRCWVPREGAELRARKDSVHYLTWAEQGHLTLTDGAETDYKAVRRQIEADRTKFQFNKESIGADPWNLTDIRQDLDPDAEYIFEFPQHFQYMSPPTKKMEALVLGEQIAHGGHPVFQWCMSNIVLLTDTNGNVRPSKKHSKEKIDVGVAALIALGQAMVAKPKSPSVYETRGVVSI
jgi:phage terminase large subunit-like protein